MKTRRTQLGLLALVLGAEGAARAAGQSCPHAEISKTRALAEQRMKAKDYAGAIAILKPLRDKCGLYSYREVNGERQADLDFYWIHSDLSFAYYRAGQLRECLSVLAELTYPGPPDGLSSNGLDDSPVAKAIAHNERLCETALLGRYGLIGKQYHKQIMAPPSQPLRESLPLLLKMILMGLRHGVLDIHAVGLAVGMRDAIVGPAYLQQILEPTLRAVETRLEHHVQSGELQPCDLRIAALSLISPLLLAAIHQNGLGGHAVRALSLDQLCDELASRFIRAYS